MLEGTNASLTERVMLGEDSNLSTIHVSVLIILLTVITFVLVTLAAHRYCSWPQTEYIAIEDKSVHTTPVPLNENVV